MKEGSPKIDCDKLRGYVELLHPKTRVRHLTSEEVEQVFPELRGDDVDMSIFGEPGGVITIGHEKPSLSLPRRVKNTLIRNLYKRNCQ